MTDRQKDLVIKLDYITKEIKFLNDRINYLELERIELANKLFDSIEDKGKVKVLLSNEKSIQKN